MYTNYLKKVVYMMVVFIMIGIVMLPLGAKATSESETTDISEEIKQIQDTIDNIDIGTTDSALKEENIDDLEPSFSEDFVTEKSRGKVIKIADEKVEYVESMGNSKQTTQYIEVKITTGKYKGKTITVENYIDDTFIYNLTVRENQSVILYLEVDETGNISRAYIGEVVRDQYVYALGLLFIAIIVAIGGKKGLKTLGTLAFTIVCIVNVFLPLTLKGYDAILLSLGICFVVTIVTILVVSGINIKSYAAILGTMGGVACAGVLAFVVGHLAALTGMGDSEAQMLAMIPQKINFDFEGLLFAGIILGALGAVMDVCMSIASSMTEIKEADPSMGNWKLFKSAMNVGKDMMGTMSNTLILAYTGSSMYTMLLFMAYDISFADIINQDFVASEVVRALAGSIGLILAIPVTAACFVLLTKKRGEKDGN